MFRSTGNKYLPSFGLKAAVLGLLSFGWVPAAWAAGPPAKSSMSEPLVFTLVILMALLLLVIALLANVLLSTARFQHETEKWKKGAGVAIVAGLLFLSSPAMAQTPATPAPADAVVAATNYGGMSQTTFYLVTGVIALEVIVILFMLIQLRAMLARDKQRKMEEAVAAGTVAAPAKPTLSWWDRFNSFRPQEQEADLDLGHNYDGIRELDNRLPPWWLYGFYITIVVAGIYLWRYHVTHSAPLSAEEFTIAMKNAERQQAEYLKNAANLVDENNVKESSAPADISAGKGLFEANCVACHGKLGEGSVGPNLTDEFWIHGGGVKDIFKTIKYGWQDKGMKSWKEDFTPSQMAQLSSYIRTLKGTNPPNGKAPQGDPYTEGATTGADSAAAKPADSTAVVPAK